MTADATSPRPLRTLIVLSIVALIGIAGLSALGIWQMQRLDWKRALIERVDRRVHAAPVAAPADASDQEYRRVQVSGRYQRDRNTFVLAVTDLGRGYWVMTPLNATDGRTYLINRGFIAEPSRLRLPDDADTTVTGLLRLSEPEGGFLRNNDSQHDRWYSRDVAAIAQARGLGHVVPYFIDADAVDASRADAPRGGLTVIAFHNNHFQYAVTWFVLAAMLTGGWLWVLRYEAQLRAAR